jgi:TetR/AcrR family transcriptional repressor of nem operon
MKNTDTKTAILDCAANLIQKVGVNAVSYNDISKIVGIRKASIHHHYPKKDDLLIALLDSYRQNYGAKYAEVVYSDLSAKEKLAGIAKIFENSLNENKICLVGMMSSERESLSQEIQTIIKDSVCKATTLYEKIFIQGKSEGTIAENVDTRGAAYTFLSFLVGSQIFMRSSDNIEGFSFATEQYIKMISRN